MISAVVVVAFGCGRAKKKVETTIETVVCEQSNTKNLNDTTQYINNSQEASPPTENKKKYTRFDKWNCKRTELSNQFDVEMNYVHYADTVNYEDSAIIRLRIIDKQTGVLLDRITAYPYRWCNYYYTEGFNCHDDATSFSTGFNADREITDNYFGVIVIADLNFDGKDDIALVSDSAIDSGPFYVFFIQNDNGKFVKSKFLTEKMQYFPNKIDYSRQQLTTYLHITAFSRTCVYKFDTITNKWKQISHELFENVYPKTQTQ